MNELLVLFGYPSGSAAALLGGWLLLRYCSGRFARRVPTWGLPARGHVQGPYLLVLRRCRGMNTLVALCCLAWLVVPEFSVVGEFLGALKEFDCAEKLQHTLQDTEGVVGFESWPKVWKR